MSDQPAIFPREFEQALASAVRFGFLDPTSMDSIADSLIRIAFALERIATWTDSNPAIYLKRVYGATGSYGDRPPIEENQSIEDLLKMSVEQLEFEPRNGVRVYNCLHDARIFTVADLISKTEEELLRFKNFGVTCLQNVERTLAAKQLKLGSRFDPKTQQFVPVHTVT